MTCWSFKKHINRCKRNTLDINDTDIGKYEVKQKKLSKKLEENISLYKEIFFECFEVV